MRRILRSFGYAFEGLALMLRTQPNFLVHLAVAALALILAAILRLTAVEFASVAIALLLYLPHL